MDEKMLRKLLRTIGLSGCAFVLNYGITLVLTPYITGRVGIEAYGYVTISRQFAQYASILTLALNAYATRHIAVEYYQDHMKKANSLYSSTFFGDLALATAILAVALMGIRVLERIIAIPPALVADVKLLFLLVFLNFWLSTLFSVFEAGAIIQNKLDMTNAFRVCSLVVEACVLLLCFTCLPTKVAYVGLGFIGATLVVGLSNLRICRRYTPQLRIRPSSFSLRSVRLLLSNGVWSAIVAVGDMLNSGLDLLICDLMLTPLAMGQLAIAKSIYTIFMGIFSMVSQSFKPIFLKDYAGGNRERLLDDLTFSMKVSSLFSNVVFAGFVALGMAYYRLWIPGQDIALIYKLTVLTIVVAVPTGIIHPLFYIYTLTTKNVLPCVMTLAGGIANVLGMYVLIRYTSLGIYAVALTTVGVTLFVNVIFNPLYMAHVMKLPLWTLYPQMLRSMAACGAMTIVFLLLSRLYMPGRWLTLILTAGAYALLGACMQLLLAFSGKDRQKLAAKLKQRFASASQ